MNPHFLFGAPRRAVFLAVYCGVSGLLVAANSDPAPQVFKSDGSPGKLSDVPAPLAAQFANAARAAKADPISDDQQSIADAKARVKEKNLGAAEQAITRGNRSKPNSAEWHLETTRKLLETARQLVREGDSSQVSALAAVALQHLDQSVTTAKTDKQKAQAKAQAGFIHSRFTGDMASAIASYQAAAKLDPSDPAIQQTLARLQESDAILRERLKANHR